MFQGKAQAFLIFVELTLIYCHSLRFQFYLTLFTLKYKLPKKIISESKITKILRIRTIFINI